LSELKEIAVRLNVILALLFVVAILGSALAQDVSAPLSVGSTDTANVDQVGAAQATAARVKASPPADASNVASLIVAGAPGYEPSANAIDNGAITGATSDGFGFNPLYLLAATMILALLAGTAAFRVIEFLFRARE
jgi:hypothetical protein